ncbi:MAG: hypothetical protein GX561_03100 [Lentisphaerae bacterium]|jgi:hypothetical protein|nr:hypothetical protein [Lentisphaerota bacterium]
MACGTKDFNNVQPIRPDYDKANYDASKIAPYELEDPLTFANGERLASKADWGRRREEILGIFAREMYGQEPPPPEALVTELVDERVDTLAGFGVRSQYKMWFKADKSGPCVNWIVFRPRYAKGPVPVISFLNYRGNYELVPDADILVTEGWSRNGKGVSDHRIDGSTRGIQCDPNNGSVFPIGTLLARGYAVMSACYCEVSPDPLANEPDERFRQDVFSYTGVFDLWGKRDPSRTDNPTALGAWAWALSRGLDLAERIPELDAKRSVVTGCSRLGKAALLAAARDDRFAVCVPNQCGGGGVCLAKRDFGENVATEMKMFSHWYCSAYGKYAKNPAELLTFDQHLLVASIAPRRVLVQGFGPNDWMDTEAEYLACVAASPAWEFLGLPGLPGDGYPEYYDTSAIGSHIGYVRRTEEHGISAYDWNWLVDFADHAFDHSIYGK